MAYESVEFGSPRVQDVDSERSPIEVNMMLSNVLDRVLSDDLRDPNSWSSEFVSRDWDEKGPSMGSSVLLAGIEEDEWEDTQAKDSDPLHDWPIDRSSGELLGDRDLSKHCFHVTVGGVQIASWGRLKEYTARDPAVSKIYEHLLDPVKHPLTDQKDRDFAARYAVVDGVLKRKAASKGVVSEEPEDWKIYVPLELRPTVMTVCHHMPLASHMGRDRLVKLLSDRFYWPKMTRDIRVFVAGCLRCKISKTPSQEGKGLLGEYTELTTEAFDVIHIDHVGGFPVSRSGNSKILTVMCRATKFLVAIPVPDETAKTTAKALFDHVFCKFGIPSKIVSDNGPAFRNTVSSYLAKRMGIHWQFCTPQKPPE